MPKRGSDKPAAQRSLRSAKAAHGDTVSKDQRAASPEKRVTRSKAAPGSTPTKAPPGAQPRSQRQQPTPEKGQGRQTMFRGADSASATRMHAALGPLRAAAAALMPRGCASRQRLHHTHALPPIVHTSACHTARPQSQQHCTSSRCGADTAQAQAAAAQAGARQAAAPDQRAGQRRGILCGQRLLCGAGQLPGRG